MTTMSVVVAAVVLLVLLTSSPVFCNDFDGHITDEYDAMQFFAWLCALRTLGSTTAFTSSRVVKFFDAHPKHKRQVYQRLHSRDNGRSCYLSSCAWLGNQNVVCAYLCTSLAAVSRNFSREEPLCLRRNFHATTNRAEATASSSIVCGGQLLVIIVEQTSHVTAERFEQ